MLINHQFERTNLSISGYILEENIKPLTSIELSRWCAEMVVIVIPHSSSRMCYLNIIVANGNTRSCEAVLLYDKEARRAFPMEYSPRKNSNRSRSITARRMNIYSWKPQVSQTTLHRPISVLSEHWFCDTPLPPRCP